MPEGLRELHVAAGIIEDGFGRVLLTQRGSGGEHPGLWEFPGGKVEQGEEVRAALRRELQEELGVVVAPLRRLHCVRWREPQRVLVLDGWRARVLEGSPQGLQGQALRWVAIDALHAVAMPPADVPLRSALQLCEVMWITPALHSESELTAWLIEVETRLLAGVRLVQLRLPGTEKSLLRTAAALLGKRCRAVGARWLLNGKPEDALLSEADGLHLSSSALRDFRERKVARATLVGASCHNADELARAANLGLDYAVLSPLRATSSHPQAIPLGDMRFAALVRDCPLPVFALGSVSSGDLDHVRALGAFGVAGIRGV